MSAAVALVNPKFEHNVGGALRACSIFGARALLWSDERVKHPDEWPKGVRLPREERMKLYDQVHLSACNRNVLIQHYGYIAERMIPVPGPLVTPVAVEFRENAEPLPHFAHPQHALYVFGPEDGSLDKGILSACHRFIVVPSLSCMNLSAAVNVVLYDRLAKNIRAHEGSLA